MDHDHQAVWEMIPWYLNGTLEDADQRRVAAHLNRCAACRAEVAEQRRLQAVIMDGTTADTHAAESWRTLQKHIRPGRDRRPILQRWASVWAAGAVAAACLAALVAMPVLRVAQGPNEFVTLTAPGDDAGELRILPAPGVERHEVLSVLEDFGLEVTEAPVITDLIRARPSASSPEEIAQALQDHPAIAFVTGGAAE
ncbi:MAG: zf-HC2 domain-containing protein [Pseudomonadota bacterium]